MATADTKITPGKASDISESNAILVVDRTASNQGYVVTHLVEDDSHPDKPYELSHHAVNSLTPELEPYVIRECPDHLRPSLASVHVIVSGKSGTGRAAKCWESVVEPLLQLIQSLGGSANSTSGNGYDVLFTESASSISEFSRSKLGLGTPEASRPQTVLLLSGDGGVVDILNGLDAKVPSPSPPIISILPFGTGNALFHSIHKPFYLPASPTPLVLGLRTLWKGTPSPLPTFRASFSPGSKLVRHAGQSDEIEHSADEGDKIDSLLGAVVASYGFHSNIVWESDTPEYRKHGAKRFGMVAVKLLQENHAYDASVLVRSPADEDLDNFHPLKNAPEKFGYMLVAQVSNLEKTFEISPATRPLDPALRLVYFGPVGGEKTMEIMGAAYAGGQHVKMEEVGYEEIGSLEVRVAEEDARWRKVCIDGTIVELEKGGWMRVEKVKEPFLRVLTQ